MNVKGDALQRWLSSYQPYNPLPAEFTAVGAIGIVLNIIIFILSLYSLLFRAKLAEVRYFYCFLLLLSVMELPRYFALAVKHYYDCSGCYAAHIIADFVYFICLALVGK